MRAHHSAYNFLNISHSNGPITRIAKTGPAANVAASIPMTLTTYSSVTIHFTAESPAPQR